MKKILVLISLLMATVASAADFSDTDVVYGWNGTDQFYQTWSDHLTQLGATYYTKSELDTALDLKANTADLGTAAALDTGTAVGDVPVLVDDGSGNASLPIICDPAVNDCDGANEIISAAEVDTRIAAGGGGTTVTTAVTYSDGVCTPGQLYYNPDGVLVRCVVSESSMKKYDGTDWIALTPAAPAVVADTSALSNDSTTAIDTANAKGQGFQVTESGNLTEICVLSNASYSGVELTFKVGTSNDLSTSLETITQTVDFVGGTYTCVDAAGTTALSTGTQYYWGVIADSTGKYIARHNSNGYADGQYHNTGTGWAMAAGVDTNDFLFKISAQ